jgi:hypothetical protein
VVALIATPGQAFADSATISVTNTAGQSDPAASLPRVFTVSGTTAGSEGIFIAYRQLGGPACAPTFDTDQGKQFEDFGDEYNSSGNPPTHTVNGAFNFQTASYWTTPGTFTFCIWFAASGSTISTPITQTITFRKPAGTITATISPVTPTPNEQATVTVTGTSEASQNVYATIDVAGGAGCAPTYATDPGSSLIDGQSVDGPFSIPETVTEDNAGNYIVCLWLASSDSDTTPVAGPQPEPFTVAVPPPPCTVPKLPAHTSLASAKSRIAASHCAVGTEALASSLTVPNGDVIALSPSSGTLAPGATVNLVVSSGKPPCVVPVAKSSLSATERAVKAAYCTVGRLLHVHNAHVAKGRVVRVSPAPGTRLAFDAAVNITISKGRAKHHGG